MKKYFTIAFLFFLLWAGQANAQQVTAGNFFKRTGETIYTQVASWIMSVNQYLNFDRTSGESGFGLRSNSGTMQFKNTGGSWTNIGSLASESDPVWNTAKSNYLTLVSAAATYQPIGSYLTAESDPLYSGSSWYSTINNASNWNTAYSWGNHALAGYLTAESDPAWVSSNLNAHGRIATLNATTTNADRLMVYDSIGDSSNRVPSIYADVIRTRWLEVSQNIIDNAMKIGSSSNPFATNLVMENTGGSGTFSLGTDNIFSFDKSIKSSGYASTTAGLYTQGSGHYGGNLNIDSSLGIGKAIGSAPLEVFKSSANSTVARFYSGNDDGYAASIYVSDNNRGAFYTYDWNDGGTGAYAKTWFGHPTDATKALIVDPSTGNVGVGLSTPSSKLTVTNNVATGYLDNFSEYQLLTYTGASAAVSFGYGISANTLVFNSGGGAYSFDRAGANTTMYMTTSGNVGIGTTTPDLPLTVEGNGIVGSANVSQSYMRVRSLNYPTVQLEDANASSPNANHAWQMISNSPLGALQFRYGNSTTFNVLTLNTSGGVGVATSTPGGTYSEKLTVVGGSYFNGAIRVSGDSYLNGFNYGTYINYSRVPTSTISLSGLVGYWKLDSTTSLLDYSGNGQVMTQYLGATTTPKGKFGNYSVFGGTGGYYTADNSLSTQLNGATQSFTMSAWIRNNGNSHDMGFGNVILTNFGSATRIRCYLAGTYYQGPAITTNDGNWHHIACVINRESNTITVYADGVAGASSDISAVGALTADNFRLGYIGVTTRYSGDMDEAAVWNRALTSFEIASLAQSARELNDGMTNQKLLTTSSVSFLNATTSNNFAVLSGVSYSDKVVCYLASGQLGHCTSAVDASGGCTCAAN